MWKSISTQLLRLSMRCGNVVSSLANSISTVVRRQSFLIDGDTLIPPFVAMDGLGENVAKQLVRARQEGEFLSKTELRKRGGLSSTLVEKMDEMGILGNMPEDNQLSLFDDLF